MNTKNFESGQALVSFLAFLFAVVCGLFVVYASIVLLTGIALHDKASLNLVNQAIDVWYWLSSLVSF